MEWIVKYRPKKLSEVIGQSGAVAAVKGFLERGVPHAILFQGPPGTGKTTLARVLAAELGVRKHELNEVNAASSRGIDTIREIDSRFRQKPLGGKARVWILDECHQLTKRQGGDAQTAALKLLEDVPDHAYFFLCTTHPQDLLKTVVSRCQVVTLSPVKASDIVPHLKAVAAKEKKKFEDIVYDRVAEAARGCVRDAVKLLDMAAGVEGTEAQLDAVRKADVEHAAIEICRTLANPRTRWLDMQKVLKGVEEDPEAIRRMILGYFTAIMLSAGGPMLDRASLIIEYMQDNFFDSGRAGLVSACYAILSVKK